MMLCMMFMYSHQLLCAVAALEHEVNGSFTCMGNESQAVVSAAGL